MYLLMLIDLKMRVLYVGLSIQAYIISGKKKQKKTDCLPFGP